MGMLDAAFWGDLDGGGFDSHNTQCASTHCTVFCLTETVSTPPTGVGSVNSRCIYLLFTVMKDILSVIAILAIILVSLAVPTAVVFVLLHFIIKFR